MRGHVRGPVPTLLFGAILTLGCAQPGGTRAVGGAPDAPMLLDGTTKSLVLVGYSTSYAWPTMLQDMLDEHSGGTRVYHLLNAVIGGSPVGRWIADPSSEDYRATYGAMRDDFFGADAHLRGPAPPPTVAIVQQSLQRTPTPETRLGPVTSVDDTTGIAVGADALEQLVAQLRADGIEHTYIAMHIYKEGYEPEVGNERFALAALLERAHPDIHGGPDVWSLTIREHPAAFTEDRLHPNQREGKLIAEAWYRSLAGEAVRQEIIDAMHARSYDIDTLMDAYLAWRRGELPASEWQRLIPGNRRFRPHRRSPVRFVNAAARYTEAREALGGADVETVETRYYENRPYA